MGIMWCPGAGFEAFPKHHSMTVSSNINILAGPAYWSTIKTLPATLPEPRSVVRGPRSEFHGPMSSSHGRRTGVTGAVSLSDLDVCYGVGWILGVGSCAFDLGCGIGGGGAFFCNQTLFITFRF